MNFAAYQYKKEKYETGTELNDEEIREERRKYQALLAQLMENKIFQTDIAERTDILIGGMEPNHLLYKAGAQSVLEFLQNHALQHYHFVNTRGL